MLSRKSFTFLSLITCLTFSVATHAGFELRSNRVDGLNGRTCVAYLRTPTRSQVNVKTPIIVSHMGTGMYTTARDSFMDPVAENLLNENQAAVLMIDKPGIEIDNGKIVINQKHFDSMTIQDLIACSTNALMWAKDRLQSGTFDGFVFLGHSEGAQVVVRVFQKLLQESPDTAGQVRGLFLTGTPLDRYEDILNFQLNADEQRSLWDSYKKRDDAGVKQFGFLTTAYLDDILKAEALSETLKHMASLRLKTPIHLFHGLIDKLTTVEAVKRLDEWNKKQDDANKPSLNLHMHYYLADHGLNTTANNDTLFNIQNLFQRTRMN